VDSIQLNTEIAKRKIQELDLSFVERRLVNIEGCSAEQAGKAIASYKNLLTLQVEYPNKRLAPPVEADRALHAHILHTKRYADDMQAIFGNFLHHDPEESREEIRDFTRQAFLEHFGVSVEAFALCWIGIEQKRAA
jgi:hypothetical protein